MNKTTAQLQIERDILHEISKQSEINNAIGTFSWNLDTKELYYSDNFYALLECEPSEFEPNVDYFNNRFMHPDDRERIEAARSQTLESKEGESWEYRIFTKSGKLKHIKAIGKVIKIDRYTFLIGSIQDITKDVLKMQQLQKRQDELRIKNIELKTYLKVIENAEVSAGLGHWHINLETNEFHMSENLYKIVGCNHSDDISFEKVLNSVFPDDRQNLIENSIRDYKRRRTSVSVFRFIRTDGKIRYIKGTSDRHKLNKVNFLVGIAHDITNLINKEIVLEEKNLQLERQNDELASFNHMASHDLQEPLRKIQVLTKLILENEESNLAESSKNYFKRIIHSAVRMQNLIDDLLDYSRTNNTSNKKVIFSLDDILRESQLNLKEDIATKEAIIKSDPLPVLKVNPSQIQQLFNNLIDNSLKYCKNDIPVEINISSKIIPGELITGFGLKKIAYYHCISFIDNGIGFDQKYEHKIFDIFQRLHAKTEYCGTGIGLTICKKVMQNHQGYITASGVPNEGSIFTLYFPIEDSSNIELM